MKPDRSRYWETVLGALAGAVIAVVGLFVLTFVAVGISAGVFLLFLEEVFGRILGEHWWLVILCLGAAAGAIIGARQK